jgi:hypothetical protein
MLFGSGVLIAGGSFVAVSLLEKLADDCGIFWLGTTLRILVPIAGMIASIYFLETNPLLRWLR